MAPARVEPPGARPKRSVIPLSICSVPPVEEHHAVPRCLLRLQERAMHGDLDGEGIQLWLEYEHECMRWGVPVEISRDDLAALVERSTVILDRDEHRLLHESDFQRWGRRGGL